MSGSKWRGSMQATERRGGCCMLGLRGEVVGETRNGIIAWERGGGRIGEAVRCPDQADWMDCW